MTTQAKFCESLDDFYELGRFDYLEGCETPLSLNLVPGWAEASYLAGWEDTRKEEQNREIAARIITNRWQ